MAGSVSGGCVESEVYGHACEVLDGAEPQLLTYGISDERRARGRAAVRRRDRRLRGRAARTLLDRLERDRRGAASAPCSSRSSRATALGAELLVHRGRRADRRGARRAAEPRSTRCSAGGPERAARARRTAAGLRRGATGRRRASLVFGAVDTAEALCRAGEADRLADDRRRRARASSRRAERLPSADEVSSAWPEDALAQVQPDHADRVVVLTHDEKFDVPALEGRSRPRRSTSARSARGANQASSARAAPRAGASPRASSTGSRARPGSTSAPTPRPRRRSRSSARSWRPRAAAPAARSETPRAASTSKRPPEPTFGSRRVRFAPLTALDSRKGEEGLGVERRSPTRLARARRRGRGGRAGRHRVHVHGGADLERRRAAASSSATCRATCGGAGPRSGVREVMNPSQQVQRADLRRRGQPARLRARHELARARAARRHARDARHALPGQGAELPERRHRRARTGRSTSPTPATGACPVFGDRARAASSASRASTDRARAAASPSSWSAEDEFEQPNGLCFSPDESLLYINDTPRAQIRSSTCRRRHALERAAVLRGHRLGRDRGGHPGRDEVRRARQRLGHRPGRRLGHLPGGRAPGRRSRCPENTGNLTWGGPTGTSSSSRARPRSTASTSRSARRRSPTSVR